MNKMVCPIDCPNRCASPNCHNANTCERWAKHEAEMEAEREKRKKAYQAGVDLQVARDKHRKKSYRHYAREKKVR